jgi:predicted RNA binding protein YcfA (HicA-like mRNA interferase family)
VPKKIRELKAMLRKVGFLPRPGKGSHTVWEHPKLREKLALSGNDSDDARRYQEKDVREFLRKLKEVQDE